MDDLFKTIDQFMTQIFKASLWFWWIVLTFIVVGSFSEIGRSSKGINIWLISTSIWLWCTIRWLRRKGYLSKSQVSIRSIEFKFFPFLLTNVVAPVLVSYLTFSLTGHTSLSLVSIPLTSFITANIDIG